MYKLYIAAVLLVVFSLPGYAASNVSNHRSTAQSSQHPKRLIAMAPEESGGIRVYKQANQAVVNITNIASSEDVYFNIVPREGTGSGSIISKEGYILTNNHVVSASKNLKVTLYTGQNLPAQIMGVDPARDLAVLKIDPPPGIVLTTIPLGDSSELQVGQRVFAIGNPFGLDRTMTQGIVSSIGRTLKTEGGRLIKGVIQTDAAINPGNSGGPLLDTSGKMVGINTAILSRTGQSAGISFAIPVNIAKRIVPELIAHHHIERPELGIQVVQPINQGLRVMKLDPNGPAAKAGLSGPKESTYQNGTFTIRTVDSTQADVITQIDAVNVHSVDDLLSYIESKKPGQVVTLTILRQGKTLKIPVKLSVSSA